jgi:hypothetical protein
MSPEDEKPRAEHSKFERGAALAAEIEAVRALLERGGKVVPMLVLVPFEPGDKHAICQIDLPRLGEALRSYLSDTMLHDFLEAFPVDCGGCAPSSKAATGS